MSRKEVGLPIDLRNRILRGTHYDERKREEIFGKFVTKYLKINEDNPECFSKYVVHFDKILDRKIQRSECAQTSKKLSYRKRKELGLYSIGKKSLKYNDLIPLHNLWIDYMTTYLTLSNLKTQGWKNSPEDVNFEQVTLKLYRADYHGCKMKVLKSLCPGYVGVEGIMIMETKNCFKLLQSNNIVKNIPKASCIFTFNIGEFQFVFYGKNLQSKPAERSSKKIKTVYISDLQL